MAATASTGGVPQEGELDKLEAELAEEHPPAEPLRPEVKEGPPPDPEAEAAAAEAALQDRLVELDREDVQAALELVFWSVSKYRGPHWELEEAEAGKMAFWTHRALARHVRLARFLSRWMPDLIAAGLIVGAVRKRTAQDAQNAAGEPDVKPHRPAPAPAPATGEPEPQDDTPPSPPPAPA
jgi:hypothetical protein